MFSALEAAVVSSICFVRRASIWLSCKSQGRYSATAAASERGGGIVWITSDTRLNYLLMLMLMPILMLILLWCGRVIPT